VTEPEPIELTIAAEEAGERLDKILSARPLGFSRSALQSFIEQGRVTLDGKLARAKDKPKAGARVVVRPLPPPPSAAIPQDIPLEILFEDAHLIVLMKPAGLVVHPAPGHPDGTLVNALRFHVEVAEGDPERPGIVHRLDRDTSGVMVVAKTELAREGLIGLFSKHDIEREYVAIAQGAIAAPLRIETLHGRDPHDRKKFTSRVREGKVAITHVHPVEKLQSATLVRCTLETGRTHQIRMHLAEHGAPILGDPVYGRPSKDLAVRAVGDTLARQALHARLLGFKHPATGTPMRFEAEPPADFQAALTALRTQST
jgi:23S rRNA pseudouridine1911/1915/1917 synthase